MTANPVRLERFEPRRGPAGDPPTVLVLGRIAVRKGVDDVVAVAEKLGRPVKQVLAAANAAVHRAAGDQGAEI